jgi:hypothetical protein
MVWSDISEKVRNHLIFTGNVAEIADSMLRPCVCYFYFQDGRSKGHISREIFFGSVFFFNSS